MMLLHEGAGRELPRVVLASASPRRRELMRYLDVPFEAQASAVEEVERPGEAPDLFVLRLAREKAGEVARRLGQIPAQTVVLGADTTVVVDDTILNKPESDEHAAEMLRMISGRAHDVLTGIVLISSEETVSEVVSSRVWFNPMSDAEIAAYVASGEPRDKAGAYAIQGRAARFVERIDGCYYNVMGLPVAVLYRMLKEIRCSANPAAS